MKQEVNQYINNIADYIKQPVTSTSTHVLDIGEVIKWFAKSQTIQHPSSQHDTIFDYGYIDGYQYIPFYLQAIDYVEKDKDNPLN